MNGIKKFYLALVVALLPSLTQAQIESFGDWSFVRDTNAACGLLSHTFTDVSRMNEQELNAFARKFQKDGGFGSNSIIELGIDLASRQASASLFSTLLNESPGPKSIIFIFGSGSKTLELYGETPRRRTPQMIEQLSHRNYVMIDLSGFLTDAAPLFRKHNSATVIINGKKINSISLRGFSAAFAKFQSC